MNDILDGLLLVLPILGGIFLLGVTRRHRHELPSLALPLAGSLLVVLVFLAARV